MPPDFDFDLKFTVKSFIVSATVDGYAREAESSGQVFSEKQKQIIGKLQPGQRLTVTDIKAQGPAGVVDLPDLSIKVR